MIVRFQTPHNCLWLESTHHRALSLARLYAYPRLLARIIMLRPPPAIGMHLRATHARFLIFLPPLTLCRRRRHWLAVCDPFNFYEPDFELIFDFSSYSFGSSGGSPEFFV